MPRRKTYTADHEYQRVIHQEVDANTAQDTDET